MDDTKDTHVKTDDNDCLTKDLSNNRVDDEEEIFLYNIREKKFSMNKDIKSNMQIYKKNDNGKIINNKKEKDFNKTNNKNYPNKENLNKGRNTNLYNKSEKKIREIKSGNVRESKNSTKSNNIKINNNIQKNPKTKNIIQNQKKKKKRKTSKKVFIIILLILLVFSSIFINRMNENGWTYGGLLATLLGHNSKKLDSLDTIYVVITGESQNLTDSIMLCAFNPKTKNASMMSIPRDTYIGSNPKRATASDKINTLYQKSPEKLLKEVNEITGLDVKYYLNIDTNGLRELIDSIGGVYFDVPIDMDYDDPTQNLHIHLKKGYQLLNGDKSEQVLRFRHNNNGTSYPNSYGDNDIGRMKTQREFIKVLAKQLISKDLLKNSKSYIEIFKQNVSTNFNIDLITDYLPYIIDVNTDELKTNVLPGNPEKCNGVWVYIIDEKEKNKIVNDLFISLDGNNNEIKEIENQNVEETNQNEEINIEIINGTNDSKKIKKAQELLEKQGYKVIKTGKTNSVTKTSIVNKTDGAIGVANQIKDILEVGSITSGDNTDSIDFTIILGKDFKK